MKEFLKGMAKGAAIAIQSGGMFLARLLGALLGPALGKALGIALVAGLLIYLVSPGTLRRLWPGGGAATRNVGTVIQGIRGMSALATAEFSGSSTNEIVNEGLFGMLPDERLILTTEGTIIAGIDLNQITEADVAISGEDVTVSLPPARIISVDMRHIQVASSQGLVPGIPPDMQPKAEQQGRQDLLAAACNYGLLARAEQEAQNALRQLLTTFDFRAITFVQEAQSGQACGARFR
ncbi:MAG TPA: DUF4230 domain-containing protein [Herpetosiphonaceae bacterium]